MKKHILRYTRPAEDSESGWGREALPLGCGYFGAMVFGIPENERIQITEKTLSSPRKPFSRGGLHSFCDLRFACDLPGYENLERTLDIDRGLATVRFTAGGVTYTREILTSYPDRVLAVKFTASEPGALSFRASVSFIDLDDDPGKPEEDARTADVKAEKNRLIITGTFPCYSMRYAAVLSAKTDGKLNTGADFLEISAATQATLFFTPTTNYRLTPEVFGVENRRYYQETQAGLDELPPLETHPGELPEAERCDPSIDPLPEAEEIVAKAEKRGYAAIRRDHLADVSALLSRCSLSIANTPDKPTDELLKAARYDGADTRALIELLFTYGRYLLVSSSREGALPAHLLGAWQGYRTSPWGCGYWHNVNIQMQYWPAFVTDLSETFLPYYDYINASRKAGGLAAYLYLRAHNSEHITTDAPEDFSKTYGYAIGTSAFPHRISMPGQHSGTGTVGWTGKMFTHWADFTGDKTILREKVYPLLSDMSRFLVQTVREEDGKYLSPFSCSCEQVGNTVTNRYYYTKGCAFDQEMLEEAGRDLLRFADELGVSDDVTAETKKQIGHYSPIHVGTSGQIKEFREERKYGSIGEYQHRHISHLLALYPGTQITKETPAWQDAARVTLRERGDILGSISWACAHRGICYARLGDGDMAYLALNEFLRRSIAPNLWTMLPCFCLDGNGGFTGIVAEMLLQTQNGILELLPALPADFPAGSVQGLVARGGAKVDISWRAGVAKTVKITPKVPGRVKFTVENVATVRASVNGKDLPLTLENGVASFEGHPGETVTLTGFTKLRRPAAPKELYVVSSYDFRVQHVRWKAVPGLRYRVLRATGDAPTYTTVADGVTADFFDDASPLGGRDHATYRVIAIDESGIESTPAVFVLNRG